MNCKVIKKMATPQFYINPLFSGLSPLSSKIFQPPPPSDSIFGRYHPLPFNKGGRCGWGWRFQLCLVTIESGKAITREDISKERYRRYKDLDGKNVFKDIALVLSHICNFLLYFAIPKQMLISTNALERFIKRSWY